MKIATKFIKNNISNAPDNQFLDNNEDILKQQLKIAVKIGG
jgi:hypothetical protein